MGIRTALAAIFVLLLLAALSCTDKTNSDSPVGPTSSDKIPPAKITDLAVYPNDNTSVWLNWSASGDDSTAGESTGYEFCWSEDYNLVASWDESANHLFDTIPAPFGRLVAEKISGVHPDAIVYFGVVAYDEADNSSEISNIVVLNPDKTIPPNPIIDLIASCLDNNRVQLNWTEPLLEYGETPVQAYDVRYSETLLTEENWAEATEVPVQPGPVGAGESGELVIDGLVDGHSYFFGIRAIGFADSLCSYSNIVSANCNDEVPPSTIDDFVIVYVNLTDITLGWTAVGDDGRIGTASFYELRVSADTITGANWANADIVNGLAVPKPAGTTERFDVPYDAADSTLYFGLKVHDEAGNVSGLATVKFQREPTNLIWQKSYGELGDEVATCATEVSDGFIIAGTIESEYTQGADIFVLKRDRNGLSQWGRIYGGAGDEYPAGIKIVGGNRIYIAGVSSSTNQGDADPYLLKLDLYGNKLDERWYHFAGTEGIVDFDKTSDGGFVMVGTTNSIDESTVGDHPRSLIMRLRSGLSMDWYETRSGYSVCTDYSPLGVGTSVIVSSTGTILYGYYYHTWGIWSPIGGCGPPDEGSILRAINNDSSWSKSVGAAGLDSYGIVVDVLYDSYTSSIITIFEQFSYYLHMARYDNTLELISESQIDGLYLSGYVDAVCENDKILVLRSYTGENELYRCSSAGVIEGSLPIETIESLELKSIYRTNNGDILVAGRIYHDYTGWDAFFALIDPDF